MLASLADGDWAERRDRHEPGEAIGIGVCLSRSNLVEKVQHYPFFGSRQADANQSLRERLIVTSDFEGRQKRFTGQTDWHIEWRACYENVVSGCRIGGVVSTVHVVYTLPRWADRDSANARLRSRWDRYLASLETHERGHGAIARDVARMIEYSLVGTTQEGSCESLDKTAARMVEEVMRRGEEMQRAYDRATAHGSAQGALFPF